MRWLLRRLVGFDLAENILGDVEEQALARFPEASLRRRLWIARELAAVTLTLVADRPRPRDRRQTTRRMGLGNDLRYAIRSLAAAPSFTSTAVAVLTLAIALATTVFAVVDGVLLKSLPYPRVDELVLLQPGWKARPDVRLGASTSEALAFMEAAPEVRFASIEHRGLDGEQVGDREPLRSAEVSNAFFDVVGQHPLVGGFRPEHFTESRVVRPALLTYGVWQRRFGLDRNVIGRVIAGDRGKSIQVVGILPPDFLFPSDQGRWVPDVLTPLVFGPKAATDRSRGLEILARLPPGMSTSALESQLQIAAEELAKRYPIEPGQRGPGPVDRVTVLPIDTALRSGTRVTFGLILSLAIGLVLLACLNVMGLAAARAEDRRRELTLRRVLGADGRHLVRLLAVESAVLVSLSSAAGLGLAWYLVRGMDALLPEELVLLKALAIDWRVGLFLVSLTASVVVLTTLWPARVAMFSDGSRGLLNSGRTTGRRGGTSRFAIIGTQVALALVMSVAGSLLAAELIRVWRQDTGYRQGQTLNLWLTDQTEPSPVNIEPLLADLRRLPGVSAVGGYNIWLLQRAMFGSRGFEQPAGASGDGGEGVGVTGGFFAAAGLRPVAGRWPSDAELSTGARVVAVSEQVARDYWPGREAVGQQLMRRGEPYTVVGVVPDARYASLEMDPFGVVYYPMAVDGGPLVSVFIAYHANAPRNRLSITNFIAARHPAFRVRQIQSVTATLADSIRQRTFQTMLFVVFALSAIVIVSVGVFGLAAVVTGRRTREVGVRLALGARPSGIMRLVLGQELKSVVCGLVAGAFIAFWSMHLVASHMYKSSVYDPLSWAAAILLLLACATAGILVPAFRASRTNPIDALRVE